MEFLLIRAIERLIAVLVGAFAIYLGYRLFLAVKTTGEGSAQVKLPYDVTVMVSRVGPGVFFALFGSALIGISLSLPVRYNEMESRALGKTWRRHWAGITPLFCVSG
jgi:hypothetical protein